MKIYTDKDPNHALLNQLCRAVAEAHKESQYASLLLSDILDYLPHDVRLGTPVLPHEMGLVMDCVCQMRYDGHIKFDSFQEIKLTDTFLAAIRPLRKPRQIGYSFHLALAQPALTA